MNSFKQKRIVSLTLSIFLIVTSAFGFMAISQTDEAYAVTGHQVTVNFKTLDKNGKEVDPSLGGAPECNGTPIQNGVPVFVQNNQTAYIDVNPSEGYSHLYKQAIVTGTYSEKYAGPYNVNVYGITGDVTVNITYRETRIIDPIDIKLPALKCGTEITVTEDQDVTQTPTPGIEAYSDCGYVLYENEYWDASYQGWFKSNEENYDYFKEDLFSGKVDTGTNIWARVLVQPDEGCDFIVDWHDYVFSGSVSVNGKASPESKGYANSGYVMILAKADIEHDWDAGKVTKKPTSTSTGVKTFTCNGCGATKTETIPKTKPAATTGKVFNTMTSKGAKSIKFSWNKAAGAAGYDIFLSRCNYGGKEFTPKKIKTIKGNKTNTWTKTGLKKGVPYKGYVKAYKMVNGKKKYISKSPTTHVFTNGGNKKYTNSKSVSVNKTKVTLNKGKTFNIKATVKKQIAGKKLIDSSHTPKLRYLSSNKKVATVSSKGKITAKAKGKCNVYAIAANGAKKAIAVTVK